MRKRVLVCAALACALSATNASAQMIANMAKRAGIGGSVGAIFTFDDDVNVGRGSASMPASRPRPGSARRLASDGTKAISHSPESPATLKLGVFASVRSWAASVTPG